MKESSDRSHDFELCASGRLVRLFDVDDEHYGYGHWCPGCKHFHPYFRIKHTRTQDKGPLWTFNGDEDNPTFGPSMLVYSGGFDRKMDDGTVKQVPRCTHCHYHLQAGKLNFCPDSPHELAAQSGILLPEIDTDGQSVWLRGTK